MDLQKLHVPGYTGYHPGARDAIGCTPVRVQLQPRAGPPAPLPLTLGAATKPVVEPNLWPFLQTTGHQESVRPPASTIILGDKRQSNYCTQYAAAYAPPLPGSENIRSPLRIKNLDAEDASLKAMYSAAQGRISSQQLERIHEHLRERLSGKLGSHGGTAFKLRKLFKRYDMHKTGFAHIEEFRVTMEAFGIQLDNDSLLALFAKYDPECKGRIKYHDLMKKVLDADDFKKYIGGRGA
ncbi:FAP252 [Auxenochlorella protothecoides x Auxenochlorella symbiontica]